MDASINGLRSDAVMPASVSTYQRRYLTDQARAVITAEGAANDRHWLYLEEGRLQAEAQGSGAMSSLSICSSSADSLILADA